ncbi:MAG: acetoacetate decarboxylase (ADC), partial [Pseudomonadales bacterium]|nr:acetoacetate decarboxylase (ADC) [Pseudomonadales bacterium]
MTKISNLQWVVTLLSLILVNSAIAETTGTTGTTGTTETDEPEYNIIDIAGYEVPVIAGGLYDRFRSNPPLSVIAEEAPEIDLSWFETIEKTKVDVGFETYSPNFFYSNTKITAIFTADMRRLRDLMPAELMHIVQP